MFPVISFSQVRYRNVRKRNFEFIPGESVTSSYFVETEDSHIDEYNPFTDKDLYKQFANINETDINEILRFIKQYGHIGEYNGHVKPYIEKYTYWCQEINQMRRTVFLSELYSSVNIQLTIKINENKIKELEKGTLYRFLKNNKRNYNKYCLSMRDVKCTNDDQRKKIKQEAYDLHIACLFDLQEIFKFKIGQISFTPFIDVDDNNKPRFLSDLLFDSLISAMYWQLYMDFFENKRFFTCEKCFKLFPYNNMKDSFICEECLRRKKYEKRSNKPKKYAHDKFFRKTLYYVPSSGISKCWSINEEQKEELEILRDKLMENSLCKMKTMDKNAYLKWLGKQDDHFMGKVKEYKEG